MFRAGHHSLFSRPEHRGPADQVSFASISPGCSSGHYPDKSVLVETITLTINGSAISARAGQTILEVSRRHGIPIPTLCHHQELRPIGVCRICQVEDEKRGVVLPACVTQIASGMSIVTDSPRVIRNRRNIIRLILAAHPESCVVCEKGNRCELRNLAARMGIGAHGLDRMPYHPPIQDFNPLMTRDLSKCILCAKCVRADQEVVCEGVIDYDFRGFDAYPATLFGQPLERAECTFCGTCLSVCPTGAIAEKNKPRLDHAGARTPGACSYCACGCSVYYEHDHMTVRGITPTAWNHTANGVSLCVKGHFGHDYLVSPDRLVTPLVRTDDGFKPIGWDEALDMAVARFNRIRDERGPRSLGFMGGACLTNEENYLFQKLARAVLGTNNVDHGSRAGMAPVFTTLRQATGFAAATNSFAEVERSKAILLIGADPSRTAPVLWYHIKRAVVSGGCQLIVVDPVESKPARMAHKWLRPHAGADIHVLTGLIKVILKEGLEDKEFVAVKTRCAGDLIRKFRSISASDSARAAGLTEKDLHQAARLFAGSLSGFIIFGQGLWGQAEAEDLLRMVIDLVLLTGTWARMAPASFPCSRRPMPRAPWIWAWPRTCFRDRPIGTTTKPGSGSVASGVFRFRRTEVGIPIK